MPRLSRFFDLFPDLTLHLTLLAAELDSGLPRVDAAIVFKKVQFPGMRAETLVRLEMFAVRTPGMAASLGEAPTPEDLRGATLIHEDDCTIWARWFAAMGAGQIATRRNVHVPSTEHALAPARAGVGLAINDGFIGAQTLAEGTQVRPFGARSLRLGKMSGSPSRKSVVRPQAAPLQNGCGARVSVGCWQAGGEVDTVRAAWRAGI